jgi:transcriptional regulator with XRE-family HTH domain
VGAVPNVLPEEPRLYCTMVLLRGCEQRGKRGLNWQQVASEVGVSAATITRTREGGRMEVDGMLAMVRWLKVPVETFVRESES